MMERMGGNEPAINFGREECGAHVRPRICTRRVNAREERGAEVAAKRYRQTVPSCELLRDPRVIRSSVNLLLDTHRRIRIYYHSPLRHTLPMVYYSIAPRCRVCFDILVRDSAPDAISLSLSFSPSPS